MTSLSTAIRAAGLAALTMLAVATSSATWAAPATPAPSDSIYQLPLTLTDQAGHNFQLADRRGAPMLVSMFYTSCQFVCPMLIDALRQTEAQLSDTERARLTVLMVSFDPAHDTVTVLKRTAEERKLDGNHWTLARADAKSVRKFAAVLGIQYRQLPSGDFNHTTAMILIDREGRIAARTEKLGDTDPAFVKLVKATVGTQAATP
jgi:protein SCO1/2